MSKATGVKDPIQPQDFFSTLAATPDSFADTQTREITRNLGSFNPNDYEYLDNPSPYDDKDTLNLMNTRNQPLMAQLKATQRQFGANFLSGFGQGVANLLDVTAWGNDNYQSRLFGYSTKDMADWAMEVASNNRILEENPGSFSPGSGAWWLNQVSQSGTGLGMGAFSLLETAAIESLTMGTGTGVALARLGSLFNNIRRVGNVAEAVNAARGLRSAATIFGVMNRVNESRMEAMNSYNEIYEDYANQTNEDGTKKYTDDEAKNLAAQGASVTFKGNMALLPLDILAYRTMVFNPVSGMSTGLIERELAKRVGTGLLGKTTAFAIGSASEGLEEGLQFIASNEGKHYADVLGGQDDGSSFLERTSRGVQDSEFWNNFAGGVIGSPIIGGAMKLTNKLLTGRATSRLNDAHANYIKNVAKMDNFLANDIKEAEEAGDLDTATNLRRAFATNKALSALHLDAMTDKDTAYSSYKNFLEGTLEELNQGKFDSLTDLNIKIDPNDNNSIDKIKLDFTQYLEDASQIESIYNVAKNQYDKNVLPNVVMTRFNINKYQKELDNINLQLGTQSASIPEFNQLTPQGQSLFNIKTEMASLIAHRNGLQNLVLDTQDEQEKANHQKVLKQVEDKIDEYKSQLDSINNDESYNKSQRDNDQELTESILDSQGYANLIHEKNKLETQINLSRKQALLYNNKEYQKKLDKKVIKKGSKSQVEEVIKKNPEDNSIKEEVKERELVDTSNEELNRAREQKNTNTPNEESSFGNQDLFDIADEVKDGFNTIDGLFGPAPDNKSSNKESEFEEPDLSFGSLKDDEDDWKPGQGTPVAFLSPNVINELTTEGITTLMNAVDTAMSHLPNDKQSFKDLVELYIKVRGKSDADKVYNGLIKGWEASGRSAVNYDEVYNSLFNLSEAFQNIFDVVSNNTIKQSSASLEKSVVKETAIPAGQDKNGQPEFVVDNTGQDIDKPNYSTLAFTNFLGAWKVITDEQGNKKVEFIQDNEDVVFGQYTDSRALLDPDKYREGTELHAEIPSNFRDILVPIHNELGEKIAAKPFGVWAAENNITEGSTEWVDKIPIIVYNQKPTENEKGLAFIHDTGWYNIFNSYSDSPANSLDKQNKTKAIRQEVYKKGSAKIRIAYKTETTLKDLRIPDGATVPISQGNPQTVIVKAGSDGTLTREGKVKIFANDIMITSETPVQNRYYGVVRYGTKGDKKTYLLQSIFPQVLGESKEVLNTIQSFGYILVASNPKSPYLQEAKEAIEKIRQITGIDISNQKGVNDFLKQYIPIQSTSGTRNAQEVKNQIDSSSNSIPNGGKYVAITAAGTVVYGKKNGQVKALRTFDDAVEFADFVKDFKHNISDLAIRSNLSNPNNKTLTIKRKNGSFIIDSSLGYNDYIKTKINTNLQSINIGTPEEPNYVSQLQPSIGIELKKDIQVKPVTTEVVTSIVNQEIKKVDEIKIKEPELSEEDRLLKEANELLGDTDLEEEFYYPQLTDENRKSIAQSVDSIAGLSPEEQEAVKNFLYQQSVEQLKNNELTPESLKTIVKESFENIFKEIIKESQDKASNIERFLLANSNSPKRDQLQKALKGLNLQINKLASVIDSFDLLYKLSLDTISKNKLITSNPTEKTSDVEQDINELDDIDDIDEETPGQSDFTTNSLRVNPDIKITPRIRFMMEGIRNVDDNGNFTQTVFKLPEYVNSGEILRYLQLALLNIPSDFDAILKKLETLKTARNWMPQVINKLKTATKQDQNSFIRAVTNSPFRPVFSMFTYNKKAGTWAVKEMDSHLGGVQGVILNEWKNTSQTKSGIVLYKDGKYTVDQEAKKKIVFSFEELKNLDNSDKSLDKIRATFLKIGVDLDIKTLKNIRDNGLYYNYGRKKWKDLFTADDGIFKIIPRHISSYSDKDINDGKTLLSNTIFNTLAREEANFTNRFNSLNHRDNGKSFFGLITPKFITDTQTELSKVDSELRKKILSTPYGSQSMLLRLLNSSDSFKEQHEIKYVADTAIKQQGKTVYGDNNIAKLSPADHELTKLSGFWYRQQGNVNYINDTGFSTDTYFGTNIKLRIASMFVPTMSDKEIAMKMKTAVLDFTNTDLMEGDGISAEVTKIIYDQVVKPDLLRIINTSNKNTGIDGFEKGKGLFMNLASLNYLEFSEGLPLIEHLRINGGREGLKIEDIEANTELIGKINNEINKYVISLRDQKKQEWLSSKLVTINKDSIDLSKIDHTYLERFAKTQPDKNRLFNIIAMDFTINSLIHNANVQMAYTGDPALYYKSKAPNDNYTQRVIDTYDNMNKRLALLIAPATPYPNGVNEKYLQVFMEDRTSIPDANFLKFLTKISDGKEITNEEIAALNGDQEAIKKTISKKYPRASAYFKIEGTDAQEYTTWKEHLNILERYGNLSDNVMNITQEEINKARQIFTSNINRDQLKPAELELISKVMQPIKPRYVGYYSQDNIQRMMYIKTSSFPLIPQLTEGFEIDNLRKLLENKEKEGYNVRASYQSGNKVGSTNTPIKIWNRDGSFNSDTVINETNSLVLDRSGWGIQQDVPFKSEKPQEDKIRLGTQLMKLLFGDAIMDASGFVFEGKSYNGKALQEIYEQLFGDLLDLKRNKFNKKLKLDKNGEITNKYRTAKVLQRLLKKEATDRGYPLNDIVGLTLDKDGNFNLPLWASNNANRYESLLNSIVNNALVKIKFPGYSYVAGSSEGFKTPEIKEEQDYQNSEIIYTSKWNGSKLMMTHSTDKGMQKAQVFLPSKFKNSENKLIDLFEKRNNDYLYVSKDEKGNWRLKEDMVDADLLNILSFRIPTSSIGSAANIEIAGFIPASSGDLIIVPSEFTKQKGMDFDVDKEYTYHYWHTIDESGKIKKVDSLYEKESITELETDLLQIKAETMRELSKNQSLKKQIEDIEDNLENLESLPESIKAYTDAGQEIERLKNKVAELKSKINETADAEVLLETLTTVNEELGIIESNKEKLIQNRLINLMQSVLANPNPEVQAKINRALSIDYAKEQATMIDSIVPRDNSLFTGLSDMYQKEQFLNGVSGKIGTGAYSLDVVFHSLLQQSAKRGRPSKLVYYERDEDGNINIYDKQWKFGNQVSFTELGNQMTVDGDRTITEVNSEQQNISVDNGKEKVLGKVNINSLTMDVDKVFNLTGLDKGEDGNKLSYTFLSQPIIKRYVELMQNSNSIMAGFQANKEKAVVDELIREFYPEGVTEVMDEEFWNVMEPLMSSENLLSELSKTKEALNPRLQFANLMRFIEMKKYGESIRAIQVAINTDSKGLNKSFFNVIEKIKTLYSLGGLSVVQGGKNLVGSYLTQDTINNNSSLNELDYIANPVDSESPFLINPTTISGKISLYGLTTAYNLYRNFLPYNSNRLNEIFNEIIPEIQGDSVTETKTVELKQEILREIKKYLALVPGNGLFENENLADYRNSLYIDSPENTSLASYIKELMTKKDDPIVNKFIINNTLLRRFEFDIRLNGTPSLIKYNNAVGEDFNEQELYNSFAHLMSFSRELPQIGNKKYTTTELAQELVAYSHLGNAIQEAIQFTKFIPSEYYNQSGYTAFMKSIHSDLVNDTEDRNIFGLQEDGPSRFALQYIQHNPARVKFKLPSRATELTKLIIEYNPEYKGKIENLQSFKLKSDAKPMFITIYNNQLESKEKQQLYVARGDNYMRVPILGTFGMDEYNPGGEGVTIVNDDITIKVPNNTPKPLIVNNENSEDIFNIKSNSLPEVIKAIAEKDNTELGIVAKAIKDYVKIKTEIEVADIDARGKYFRTSDIIKISPLIISDHSMLARTILHETIHSLTINQINNHITELRPGVYKLNQNAPKHVENLLELYNVARGPITEQQFNDVYNKAKRGESLTEAELTIYNVSNIYEFIAATLTDNDFQKKMQSVKFMSSGKSLWQRFVEIVNSIFKSLGVQFDEEGVTANAIAASLQLIQEENPKQSQNPYTNVMNEAVNSDLMNDEDLKRWNEEMNDDWIPGTGEDVGSLSPYSVVDDYINNLTEDQIKDCD